MIDPHLLQRLFLEIPLHDIHFTHCIGNRGSRCKYDSPAAIKFRKILAFKLHVCGFFCAYAADSGNIVHFRKDCGVLEIVCLVHHDTVHAKFFKCYQVILFAFIRQFLKLCLQILLLALHLFHRPAFAVSLLHLLDGSCHFLNLVIQHPCFSLR